jgi:nitroreductase
VGSRAAAFLKEMEPRRSVRQFSPEPLPPGVIEACIRTASTAPSGANRQPWHFVLVRDAVLRRRIREEAEGVERAFYRESLPGGLRESLDALGTSWEKPFLVDAPALVALFAQTFRLREDGTSEPNPYPVESASIAAGFFIAAVHWAGLATVPYTPRPISFLASLLGRPRGERGLFLFPVGYPAGGATAPALRRKSPEEFLTILGDEPGRGPG